MGLTGLHNSYSSWHLYICRFLYSPSTFFVEAMGSCFRLVTPHQHGIAVGQQTGLKALCTLPFTAEAGARHPFKRQHHITHVGTGGWEPQGSSPTACVYCYL